MYINTEISGPVCGWWMPAHRLLMGLLKVLTFKLRSDLLHLTMDLCEVP